MNYAYKNLCKSLQYSRKAYKLQHKTINGVPIALQGSPTAHGGTIPAGVPGAVIITKNTSVLGAGAEGEPAVYNLQWVKEEQIIRDSKIEKVVTLVADTRNIPNGEEVTVKVHTPEQDGGSSMLTELKGIVHDNQVQVEWKVEQNEEDENAPKIKKTYYTDLNGDIIEKGDIGQEVYLVIEGHNLSGETSNLYLEDPDIDFEYQGEHLLNDTLKNYTFKSDNERIKLKVITPKNNN